MIIKGKKINNNKINKIKKGKLKSRNSYPIKFYHISEFVIFNNHRYLLKPPHIYEVHYNNKFILRQSIAKLGYGMETEKSHRQG